MQFLVPAGLDRVCIFRGLQDACEGSRQLASGGVSLAAGIVRHVTVGRKERLREGFLRFRSNRVADRAVGRGAKAGGQRRGPVGGFRFAGVRRANDDFRGTQFVGESLESAILQSSVGGNFGGSGFVRADFHRKLVRVIRREDTEGQADVLQVVHAFNALSFGFCFRESRQEHARQDRDDRNDDQQLDEREGCFVFAKYAFHDCSFGYWVTVRAL